MSPQKKTSGCGCSSIPFSLILLIVGVAYFGFSQRDNINITSLLNQIQGKDEPVINAANYEISPPKPTPITTSNPPSENTSNLEANIQPAVLPAAWTNKVIKGIYLSRYQVTNNADEAKIRERVRYLHSQGFNTIIHGVWGNGCTMYNSKVMKQTFGFESCPNLFQDKWLDWLTDEAHQHGMEVHAYFEKGIKIDKNSPIFDLAVARNWLVPGVDRTYSGIDHYVLDVEIPEVANLFKDILVEFVEKYPTIDAVQWDDYVAYHAELPGDIDRTSALTTFMQELISAMRKANPNVSFDLCHHNPYWAKRYFSADWKNWDIDRVFIQSYNDNDINFKAELNYAKEYDGIAITELQFYRLGELLNDNELESILIFPSTGEPEQTASLLKTTLEKY